MSGAVLHLVGPAIAVGTIRRQRCMWCGALLQEDDLARMAWSLNEDGSDPGPPGAWPAGEVVSVEDGNPRVMSVVPEDEWPDSAAAPGVKRLPDGCCALLDAEVTR
jgi:hypothetical protein